MKQVERVRALLLSGVACGKDMYRSGLPNGRTRAGEIAAQIGMVLVSEPCAHRAAGEPFYHDYKLAKNEPAQLTLA